VSLRTKTWQKYKSNAYTAKSLCPDDGNVHMNQTGRRTRPDESSNPLEESTRYMSLWPFYERAVSKVLEQTAKSDAGFAGQHQSAGKKRSIRMQAGKDDMCLQDIHRIEEDEQEKKLTNFILSARIDVLKNRIHLFILEDAAA
jgi:hypothetical protein